ncbi:MAG: SGNH/GDSL hydrolase family protein [Alphaproteobacteria bacterium]|nr:SGNH/GDSL hydrolase family protein [Alphaproteobacteria bacterium]
MAVLALSLVAALPAAAMEMIVPESCQVPASLLDDLATFPQAARRVATERRLVIVAVGASSTEGAGASKPASAWPARLGDILSGRFQGVEVQVVNLGQRRQTARMVLDRMARDIAPLHPSLVIWESGTVEAARAEDPGEYAHVLMRGAEAVSELPADLIVMDPQYARDTARVINFQPYVDAVHQAASMPDVNLFPRYEIMRAWAEDNRLMPRTRDAMLKGNDDIYDCVAQLLADVIDRGLREAAHAQRR